MELHVEISTKISTPGVPDEVTFERFRAWNGRLGSGVSDGISVAAHPLPLADGLSFDNTAMQAISIKEAITILEVRIQRTGILIYLIRHSIIYHNNTDHYHLVV